MDELTNEVANETTEEVMKEMPPVPVRRQRRKRTKFEIFKEAYLPFVIVALAAILVITFVIGSVSRAVTKKSWKRKPASPLLSPSRCRRLNFSLRQIGCWPAPRRLLTLWIISVPSI